MSDTPRTLTALTSASTGLLKDNTIGSISAQDLRDAVVSMHPAAFQEFLFTGAGTSDAINISDLTDDYTFFVASSTELFVNGIKWYRNGVTQNSYTEDTTNYEYITPAYAIPSGAHCLLRCLAL